MPLPEDLHAVRQRIADHPETFLKVIQDAALRSFGPITGDKLARVPRGFSADHPAADYLKHKNYLAARSFPPDVATSPVLCNCAWKRSKVMLPFVRF